MRATVAIIAITASAGLAVYGALERQAALKLNQENDGLRQRLSQMDKPAVETQRVSNLVADANGLLSQPDRAGEMSASTEEEELVRLRQEVKALRDQTREIENLQANTRELRAGAEAARKTEV